MEQHFQKFPRRGCREVYPNFCILPFNFSPKISRIFSSMVCILEIQQFPEFWNLFQEISVPFAAFSKHSKVLVEWKALYISDAGNAGTYSLTKTQTSKIVIWTITFNCLYCLKVLFTPWSHGSFCDHELSQICVPWNGHKACEGENRKQTRLRNVTLHRQLL